MDHIHGGQPKLNKDRNRLWSCFPAQKIPNSTLWEQGVWPTFQQRVPLPRMHQLLPGGRSHPSGPCTSSPAPPVHAGAPSSDAPGTHSPFRSEETSTRTCWRTPGGTVGDNGWSGKRLGLELNQIATGAILIRKGYTSNQILGQMTKHQRFLFSQTKRTN